ncbi:hypothetical protein BFC20_10510 [Brochothrix thermosphacta]|uniref:gp58-like family protein n=1 Tax=Brochothrix thermosphacta TaxID=2756 RepID=UPI000EF2DDD2|nr:gp58-like family protein [Brochothrix thermosphacta]ANZ98105.1 hypothetical protein BFC20_10510 [Brochothrix thermosphacta]
MAIIKGTVEVTKKAYDTSVAQQTADDAKKETIEINKTLTEVDKRVSEAQSKADESLEKAQEGFDKGQSAIDDLANLKIGSNNLLPNSSYKYGFDNWEGSTTSPYFIRGAESDYPSASILEIAKTTSTTQQKASVPIKIKADTTYTISFDIKLTGAIPQENIAIFGVRSFDSADKTNSGANATKNVYVRTNVIPAIKTGVWFRVSAQYLTDSSEFLRVIPYNGDGTSVLNVQYRRIQVEEGNISTDWTESSSDVDKAVLLVDNKMGAIAGRVTDAEGNITTLTATAEGLQTSVKNKADSSTVTQLADVVASKVSNADFESNKTQTAELISASVKDKADSSTVTQLADNINLKVDKNGIINQINVSSEGILIAGENVWISGKTKIDNAVIKNAMIDSLSANKLTAGTIDAGKINVVNLNASNISAGIITGANLAINLNSGEVTFQKGIIKRADELFSIDVTKGIVESYDSNGGFTISKGEITLNSSPELTIGNPKKYGTITYKWRLLDASGLALIGEDGYSLGTSNAVKNIANSTVNQGSAISGNKEGYLNVFSRQVINLSSGDLYSYGSLNYKSLASIEIGNTSGNKSEVAISADTVRLSATSGEHILLSSDSTSALVRSTVIYSRTYASAANMYITGSGTIGRSTSASKYKLAIEEDKTDNYKNILKLKHKTWYDKANTEAYARALDDKDTFDWDNPADEVLPVERIHGLIAEDLVEAGLTEFVSYGELNEDGTKEVEGIQYDRLVVPLLQIVKDHQIEIEKLKERIK